MVAAGSIDAMGLFEELKRRNVFRVGAAYLVIGWVLVQVANSLEEALNLPPWFDTVTVGFLAIGLPVALFLSWVYELRPETPAEDGPPPKFALFRPLNLIIIVGLAAVIGFYVWDPAAEEAAPPEPAQIAEADRPTIAVLPFVNMSNDPEQEFFSDGITEEIVNILVKERALKVVSRTSAFSFKGQNLDIPTIAGRLGAAYIVEGSVRRSGDTLRITAQLIEAASDTHLWSETYDRAYTDIFAIQEEIAGAISTALGENLGFTAGSAAGGASRLEDLVVYEDFLRARALLKSRDMDAAGALFEQVIERAPDYALGWSYYAVNQAYKLDIGLAGIDQPFTVVETLASARWATAQAVRLAPGDAMTLYAQGMLARSDGRIADEIRYFREALEVDAENSLIMEDYVEALMEIWHYKEAHRVAEILFALDPGWVIGAQMYGAVPPLDLNIESSLARRKEIIKRFPTSGLTHWRLIRLLLGLGRWEEADALLDEAVQNVAADDVFGFFIERLRRMDFTKIRDWVLDPNRARLADSGIYPPGTDLRSRENTVEFLLQTGNPEVIFSILTATHPRSAREIKTLLVMVPEFHYLLATSEFKAWIRDQERRLNFSIPTAWREHGFPRFCRALGDDDFECSMEFAE